MQQNLYYICDITENSVFTFFTLRDGFYIQKHLKLNTPHLREYN